MRLVPIVLAAALLSGSAVAARADGPDPKGEAELAKLLKDRVPGKPVNCINYLPNRSSTVIRGTAIVYEGTGRTIYVNRPRGGGSTLTRDDILVQRIWGSQLCRQDIVRLVDRTSRFPRGFVSLGEFVPYSKPKA